MLSVRGLRQAQEEFGIVAKALVCGMRQSDQNSPLASWQKPTKLVIKILSVLTLLEMSTNYSPEDIRPSNRASQKVTIGHDASRR